MSLLQFAALFGREICQKSRFSKIDSFTELWTMVLHDCGLYFREAFIQPDKVALLKEIPPTARLRFEYGPVNPRTLKRKRSQLDATALAATTKQLADSHHADVLPHNIAKENVLYLLEANKLFREKFAKRQCCYSNDDRVRCIESEIFGKLHGDTRRTH